MSLLKLPFLASVAWGTHITMTPPNAPPSLDERLAPAGFEVVVPELAPIVKVGGHQGVQVFFWAASLSEMAVIVACSAPSFRISQHILKLLVRSSNPSLSSLRITFPFLVGWSFNLVGSFIRRHCYRIMDNQFTFELSIRRDHKLITTGPYAIVRHPSYTGAILSGVGAIICHSAPGSWLRVGLGFGFDSWFILGSLLFGAGLGIQALRSRMGKEDNMLKEQFGRQWDQWAARVPYKLFPVHASGTCLQNLKTTKPSKLVAPHFIDSVSGYSVVDVRICEKLVDMICRPRMATLSGIRIASSLRKREIEWRNLALIYTEIIPGLPQKRVL